MLLSKIFFALVSLILLSKVIEGSIFIKIDPEDMEQVSEFFENIIYNGHTPFPPVVRNNFMKRFCTSLIGHTVQMLSIMISLVGSNLITAKLQEKKNQEVNRECVKDNEKNTMILNKNVKMCDGNFGCNRGVCWKECKVERFNNLPYKSWCFTSADKNEVYHECKSHLDCSTCWECTNPCVSKVFSILYFHLFFSFIFFIYSFFIEWIIKRKKKIIQLCGPECSNRLLKIKFVSVCHIIFT